MKSYLEQQREIPIIAKVDVLVLGSGPAGFSAAVNAAREGAKTMLIEQTGEVGGIATAGLMSHWTGNTEGGFYEEILSRSADLDGELEQGGIGFNGGKKQIINPERLKTVMLDMLDDAGVNLRLYTFACEAIMDGNTINGVIIESKSGREAILSQIVIDCTGDGDIAAKAGAEYNKGRESDGLMQPATIMFKVAGVDYDRAIFPGCFEHEIMLENGVDIQTLGKSKLKSPAGHVLLYRTSLPGVVTCNMTNCTGIDGTNAEDLTKATYVCRRQMHEIVKFLQENVPGYEKCYLISSASLIGIRETRHFKGLSTINEKDIEQARVFEDWAVTKVSFNTDVHNMTGSGLDKTGVQHGFAQPKGYTIPYGCFIPEKIDHLMLAGRNISGTHLAHANFRAMPICANMGQSVGVAAAMCVKSHISPRNLEIKKLQDRLMQLGVSPH